MAIANWYKHSSYYGILIWDIETSKIVKNFTTCDKKCISDIKYSPDGKNLAISELNKISIWNLESNECIKNFISERPVSKIHYSPDGKNILVHSTGSNIEIWNITTGKNTKIFQEYRENVSSIGYSPNGTYLYCNHGENIHILDLYNNTVSELRGHERFVYSIDYSPDSKYFASSSLDKTICIWESSSKKCLKILHNDEYIENINYSQDGTHLVGCRHYNTDHVYIWDTRLWKCTIIKYDRARYVKMDKKYLHVLF